LGLAISRQLVQLMDSDIRVSSSLGQGSRFWFDLDLTASLPGDPSSLATQRVIVGYRGDRRTILVVDDKEYNRAVIIDLLAPLGFELLEAANGQEGLDLAVQHQPDAVLVDLVMPLMDGFEMTRRLKQIPALQTVVAIAISASVMEFDDRQSQLACCDDFLPKPIHEPALLEKLQLHLGLEWLYDLTHSGLPAAAPPRLLLSPSPPPPFPPRPELDTLLNLALMGDLKGVAARSDRLEQQQRSGPLLLLSSDS
jgi:CheY-like chemotaxis protein